MLQLPARLVIVRSVTRADERWGTIPRLVQDAARRFPNVEAIADGDVRLSYPELADAVVTSARAFIAAGVLRGDRIAIWAPNIHEWILAALGAQSAGASIVPLNTRFKGREATDIIGRSKATMLFTVEGFLGNHYVQMLRDTDQADQADLPDLRRIVIMRGDVPDGCESWADFLAGGQAVDPSKAHERIAAGEPDELSDIIFTSGTTGRPKGVMCTHAQTLRTFEDWSGIIGMVEGDRYLIVNPFFHTFGYKAGFVSCILRGATIVPEPVFDVDAVLAKVAAERITMLPGPPTIYLSILAHPDRGRYDLSTLRLAVTGAAAIPVEMIVRMRNEMTFRTIITGYGLTESTGTISMCRADDDADTIANTSGRAISDVEVRIIGDDGVELPRGAAGEIVCRGYNVTSGYLDDPNATAETIDADGWLHTGDIGTMDDRGYLRITDRKKDMFIVGGNNAYPAEIENMLLRYPGVAQVAVVGIPDDRLGEVGAAFIVPRANEHVDPAAVIAWCRNEMANYKVPRHVHVVGSLPMNASGKVLKFELRSLGV
jgi:HIP---CoA ligase